MIWFMWVIFTGGYFWFTVPFVFPMAGVSWPSLGLEGETKASWVALVGVVLFFLRTTSVHPPSLAFFSGLHGFEWFCRGFSNFCHVLGAFLCLMGAIFCKMALLFAEPIVRSSVFNNDHYLPVLRIESYW